MKINTPKIGDATRDCFSFPSKKQTVDRTTDRATISNQFGNEIRCAIKWVYMLCTGGDVCTNKPFGDAFPIILETSHCITFMIFCSAKNNNNMSNTNVSRYITQKMKNEKNEKKKLLFFLVFLLFFIRSQFASLSFSVCWSQCACVCVCRYLKNYNCESRLSNEFEPLLL